MGHLTLLGDAVGEVADRALRLARRDDGEFGGARRGRNDDDGMMDRPPERIEVNGAGVVLRRHRPDDLDALYAMIETSRAHLRPFMPWADQDRAATATFVAKAAEEWATGHSFSYLIAETDPAAGGSERLLGGCGLHRRSGPGSLEIGYWLRPDATGRGIMTAVGAALTAVAVSLDGIVRVEIHCDEANEASAAVARRLGYRFVGTLDHTPEAPGETGRRLLWAYGAAAEAAAVSPSP